MTHEHRSFSIADDGATLCWCGAKLMSFGIHGWKWVRVQAVNASDSEPAPDANEPLPKTDIPEDKNGL